MSLAFDALLRRRSGPTAALLLAGAVGLLALPSAVLAFSSSFEAKATPELAISEPGSFLPATVDPRLARSITVRTLSKGRLFRFTPAAEPNRLDRSVTVVVRQDGAGRGLLAAGEARAGASSLAIAPTAYSLGARRGYSGFSQNSAVGVDIRKLDAPDLASFRPSSGVRPDNSRFSTRLSLDEHERAGRSPRTFEGQEEQTVDLGGSYRVTRNLDVTAGVRYSTEHDRLVPLTDGRQDNQAVYVGTQFRF